jgi:hypothetical protein
MVVFKLSHHMGLENKLFSKKIAPWLVINLTCFLLFGNWVDAKHELYQSYFWYCYPCAEKKAGFK